MPTPVASTTETAHRPAAPLTFARWFAGIIHRWRTVVVVAATVVALFVLAAVVLPPTYRAEASFVSNTSSGVKLSDGLAGLAGMASGAGLGALGGEPSESPAFYTQLIQSRELLTRVLLGHYPDHRTEAPADSARLVDILELKGGDHAGKRLERGIELMRRAVSFNADARTNLVEIDVDMPDAQLSADVANRIVEHLGEFNREQRQSRARAKREFVEGRYREAESALRAAEARHRQFLVSNRILRSPQLIADEAELQRSVDLAEDLFRTLRRELETARIDEIDTAPIITVVDRAVPPQRPRWPRPAPLVVLAGFTGVLLGLLVAGTLALAEHWARENPDDAAAVRRAGRRRRRPIVAPEDAAAADQAPPAPVRVRSRTVG